MGRVSAGYRAAMTLRVLTIVLGGWFLASASGALTGLGLYRCGMVMDEAMLLAALLSFLYYIAIVMWAFARRTSLLRPLTVAGLSVLSVWAAAALAPRFLAT